MDMQLTPEQVIAAVKQLSDEQRATVLNALLAIVPAERLETPQQLQLFLQGRIAAARNGDFSEKTLSDIKREARLT